MNYKKIYNDLIESRFELKSEREIEKKNKIKRYEVHHIIPHSFNGTSHPDKLGWEIGRLKRSGRSKTK